MAVLLAVENSVFRIKKRFRPSDFINGSVGTRAEQRTISTLWALFTHSHSIKQHTDITHDRKTESIIIGAIFYLHSLSKSLREHHTLRNSSNCTAF